MRAGLTAALVCIVVSFEAGSHGCAHAPPPCTMSLEVVEGLTTPPTALALAAFAMASPNGELPPRAGQLCDGRAPTEISVPSCSGTGSWTSGLTEARMDEERIVLTEMDDTQRLLWLQTHDAPDGARVGPVLWLRQGQGEMVTRGLGILRAYPYRVDARPHAVFTEDTLPIPRRRRPEVDESIPLVSDILLVASSRCPNGETGDTCALVTTVMLLDRDVLRMPLLLESNGRCSGTAALPLERTQTVTDSSVPVRRFDYAASLDFDAGGLVIGEQVTVVELDPAHPEVGERHVREMTSRLRWTLYGARMMADRVSLWDRALRLQGSLEGRASGHTVERP